VIVLGIDPGTRKLGWGVVEREGNRIRHCAHGVISLDGNSPLAERLVAIESGLATVIERYDPEVGSVESLFFNKDAQAAAKLGHARGVVLYCLARAGVAVAEYAPAKVKRTVAGGGQADKRQVALLVRAVLGLAAPPPSDAADALALAITHLRIAPFAAQAEAILERAREKARALRASARAAAPGRRVGRFQLR
jgi:crossover junction endodeoxyribonuclease RuvC